MNMPHFFTPSPLVNIGLPVVWAVREKAEMHICVQSPCERAFSILLITCLAVEFLSRMSVCVQETAKIFPQWLYHSTAIYEHLLFNTLTNT